VAADSCSQLFELYAEQWSFYLGVKYISAGLGSIIGAIFPLWLVLIGAFGNRSAVRRKTLSGLVLGFTGICVIFFGHLQDFLQAEFRFGIFISLIATWSGLLALFIPKNMRSGIILILVWACRCLFRARFYTPFQLLRTPAFQWPLFRGLLGRRLLLVLISSVLTFAAYLYALQHLPTEQVSVYAYVNPVIAFLAGTVLFGERLTIAIVAGVLITLAAFTKVNRAVNAEQSRMEHE
jgi:drug/metabolite transporter (DMT)-like permease